MDKALKARPMRSDTKALTQYEAQALEPFKTLMRAGGRFNHELNKHEIGPGKLQPMLEMLEAAAGLPQRADVARLYPAILETCGGRITQPATFTAIAESFVRVLQADSLPEDQIKALVADFMEKAGFQQARPENRAAMQAHIFGVEDPQRQASMYEGFVSCLSAYNRRDWLAQAAMDIAQLPPEDKSGRPGRLMTALTAYATSGKAPGALSPALALSDLREIVAGAPSLASARQQELLQAIDRGRPQSAS